MATNKGIVLIEMTRLTQSIPEPKEQAFAFSIKTIYC